MPAAVPLLMPLSDAAGAELELELGVAQHGLVVGADGVWPTVCITLIDAVPVMTADALLGNRVMKVDVLTTGFDRETGRLVDIALTDVVAVVAMGGVGIIDAAWLASCTSDVWLLSKCDRGSWREDNNERR